MLEINTPDFGGQPPIDAYGNGGFRIGAIRHNGSLLLTPSRALEWSVKSMDQIGADSFAVLEKEAADIELLLLGCGVRIEMVPKTIREALRAMGMTLEQMDTGAACRTYNVLLAEKRKIAAALIAVD